MDPALLTTVEFWNDPEPVSLSHFPGVLPDDSRLFGTVVFETSGSSGTPKWVVISKKALLASAEAVNGHLQVTRESCWGLALPVHHVGGFGVAARAYQGGCRFETLGQKWEPNAFEDWVSKQGVTHTSLVPTQVHDLVKKGVRASAELRAVVVGGGHLDLATGQAARDLGWPVLASYGMTEASSQIATQRLDQIASPYQSSPIPLLPIWSVLNSPDGLLKIAGPALFDGTIILSSGSTKGNLYIPRTDEFYITSDRVLIGDAGITPLGRADSLVKILGELVDPEKIERELVALSEGGLVAGTFVVLAVADERAGHLLIPIFEESVDKAAVISTVNLYQNRAPGFRRLQRPAVVSELPRSSLGKVLRKDLGASSNKFKFL